MRPLRAVPAKGHTSFLVSTLYAQAQQPDAAKLKADAQKVVSSLLPIGKSR